MALLYLVSGVLFILALRGLSHPESSRLGNRFGMIGMAVAVVTTLLLMGTGSATAWILIILAIVIGGGIGAYIAKNIPMTAMPELVAAFHSLVGMAAVFVAAAALYSPAAFDISDASGHIKPASLLEMALGAGIGAITFTGSVIAFGKLSGRVSGIQRFGIFVKLDETGADGLVPVRSIGNEYFHFDSETQTLMGSDTGMVIGLGQPVLVRLAEAVPVTGGLLLDLIEIGGKTLATVRRRTKRRAAPRHKSGKHKATKSVSRKRRKR